MGAILVRVGNASRRPLDDRLDIHVVSAATDATVAVASDVHGSSPVKFDGLIERQTYLVKVFPMRHRPVAQFAMAGSDDEPAVAQLYAPLHPDRVRAATFPEYETLHADLRRVLDVSAIEGVAGQGRAGYDALTNMQKAGLLNLFAKMSGIGFGAQRTVWTFVDRVCRVRGDRIFVDVQPALRDLVKAAIATDLFREVPGALHTPPFGYAPADSFKTGDQYGNLQLTFFSSVEPPLSFKVDADIDNAAGLGHAFQVLRNWATMGATHPYDVHQILVFRQEATLPYDLA